MHHFVLTDLVTRSIRVKIFLMRCNIAISSMIQYLNDILNDTSLLPGDLILLDLELSTSNLLQINSKLLSCGDVGVVDRSISYR